MGVGSENKFKTWRLVPRRKGPQRSKRDQDGEVGAGGVEGVSDSGSRGPDPDTTSWVGWEVGGRHPWRTTFYVPDSVQYLMDNFGTEKEGCFGGGGLPGKLGTRQGQKNNQGRHLPKPASGLRERRERGKKMSLTCLGPRWCDVEPLEEVGSGTCQKYKAEIQAKPQTG